MARRLTWKEAHRAVNISSDMSEIQREISGFRDAIFYMDDCPYECDNCKEKSDKEIEELRTKMQNLKIKKEELQKEYDSLGTPIKPERIQRKRTKGWKVPFDTVYVGRPSKWGNPVKIGVVNTLPQSFMYVVKNNDEAVKAYTEWIYEDQRDEFREEIRKELKGKNLCCWCPLVDKEGKKVPCHADVLLEIANS